jgi:glutamate carboxypeptidase
VASFEADLRAGDLDGRNELIEKIEQRIGAVASSVDPRVKINHVIRIRPPFAASAANKQLFDLASQTASQLGFEVHALVSPGGSDASFAGAAGIPTIDGLGPITHEMCSRRERTEFHSIATQGALLACLIRRASLSQLS